MIRGDQSLDSLHECYFSIGHHSKSSKRNLHSASAWGNCPITLPYFWTRGSSAVVQESCVLCVLLHVQTRSDCQLVTVTIFSQAPRDTACRGGHSTTRVIFTRQLDPTDNLLCKKNTQKKNMIIYTDGT